ncbi:MAG: DUF87 domain-containing protein [Planctomycetales bacterium]|nr:DUF87 domain-containing protein [Planctomycetales bacterium]
MQFRIGTTIDTNEPVSFPLNAFSTHFQSVGGTGTGKSTHMCDLLCQTMLCNTPKIGMFVIDPLGGLAESIVDFVSHPVLCPESVRKRFVYIEPANTDYVMPFNSLQYSDEDDLNYRAWRMSACFMRSGRTIDSESQPRLARWLYNSFSTIAALGYPPAAAQFLTTPGTAQHNTIVSQMPEKYRLRWADVFAGGVRDRMTVLDSFNNRSATFFSCEIFVRMLAMWYSTFVVPRFVKDSSIVLINLAPKGRMDPHIAHTLGAMFVNEILVAIKNMRREDRRETILAMDEFQHFINEDIYENLPLMRQMKLSLFLSHQSFSQLKRGDIDLRPIVWQARSRAFFCNDGEDADLMAQEIASQTFNALELKDQIQVFRQKKVGFDRIWLRSENSSVSTMDGQNESSSEGSTHGRTYANGPGATADGDRLSDNESSQRGTSRNRSWTSSNSTGQSETLVDRLEDFYETSSRSYYTFDEQMRRAARFIRELRTGQALFKFVNDSRLYHTKVEVLKLPLSKRHQEARAKLLEENFQSDLFLPKHVVETQWQRFISELGEGRRPNTIEGHVVSNDEDVDTPEPPQRPTSFR